MAPYLEEIGANTHYWQFLHPALLLIVRFDSNPNLQVFLFLVALSQVVDPRGAYIMLTVGRTQTPMNSNFATKKNNESGEAEH